MEWGLRHSKGMGLSREGVSMGEMGWRGKGCSGEE